MPRPPLLQAPLKLTQTKVFLWLQASPLLQAPLLLILQALSLLQAPPLALAKPLH
jgi:hypothetical protein